MGKRAPVFLLVLVAAVAAGFWLWPDEDTAGPDSAAEGGVNPDVDTPADFDQPKSVAAPSTESGSKPRTTMPRPVRMRSSRPPGAASGLASSFASEERDDEWARAREDEVARRARTVLASAAEGKQGQGAVVAGKVECRERSCALPLSSADPAALARAIEWLGEEQGFYRYATDMMVEAVERDQHGPRAVMIYLRFSR